LRDPETINIALRAAETGHMVFSTVHTTDAAKTVGRLIGVFLAEEQQTVRLHMADDLQGVISQRLLPRADGKRGVAAIELEFEVPRGRVRHGGQRRARARPGRRLRRLVEPPGGFLLATIAASLTSSAAALGLFERKNS